MFRINKMNPEKLKEKQAVQGKKRGEKQDKRGLRGNIYILSRSLLRKEIAKCMQLDLVIFSPPAACRYSFLRNDSDLLVLTSNIVNGKENNLCQNQICSLLALKQWDLAKESFSLYLF